MKIMEIKVRAWDESTKIMRYAEDFDKFHTDKYNSGELIKRFDNIMFWSYMQDKNQVNIYAGDILRLVDDAGHTISVVCEFGIARRANDRGALIDIPSFYFLKADGAKSYPIVHNYAGKHDLALFEIVGNIYENPELIPA